MNGPTPGTIESGYRFLGGDPASPENWEFVSNPQEIEAYQFATRPNPVVGLGQPGPLAAMSEGGYMGWAGELGGAIKGGTDWLAAQMQGKDIPYGQLYDVNRRLLEGQIQQYAQENPKTSLALTAGTGLLTGLAALPAAPTLGSAAGTGAAIGAFSGAGAAPEMADIPGYAAGGAAFGAVAPFAIKGILSAGKGIFGLMNKGAKAVGQALGIADDKAASQAMKQIQDAFSRDGITLEQAAAKMKELGPEATLADVGGRNVSQLLQSMASLPGKTMQAAETTLQSRMAGSANRLTTALRSSLGTNKSAFQTSQQIIKDRASQAGPLYKDAATQSVDPNKLGGVINYLDDIIDKTSNTKLGRVISSVRNSLVKNVDGTKVPKLKIEELHLAKMDLDDRISTAIREGKGQLSSELMKVKSQLLSVMDDIPQYKQARDIFAGDSAVLSAMKQGEKILKVDAEEMSNLVQNMSKSEWDGYVLGAIKTISDTLRGSKIGSNSANRLSTYIIRDRLRNAFPSDEAFEQFMKQVNIEDTFAKLRNITVSGSPTQMRFGAQQEYALSAAQDAMRGQFFGAATNAISKWISQFDKIPEPVRDKIGQALLSDIANQGKITNNLMEKMARHQIRTEQVSNLINMITSTATPGAATAAGVSQ